MNSKFDHLLPDPSEKDNYISPEFVLLDLANSIDGKYQHRISALVTSSAEISNGKESILTYTFRLIFHRHNDFNYPLINVKCKNNDGLYPIEVTSHYGPPEIHGIINTKDEFEKVISDILQHRRTRNIILSMY